MKGKDAHKKIVMKITGKLVDMLVAIAPEIYGPYVVYKNRKNTLYVIVLIALYGMLISAMLWYNKFQGNLKGIGFEFNLYNPCVANCIVKKKQQTI